MLTIAVETPLSDDVRRLVGELNEASLALSPREFCHHMTVEQMAGADTTLFVARDGQQAAAIGALKRHGGGVGEVKRMYTVPAYRGRGLAGRILGEVEALARREGLDRLVLKPVRISMPPRMSMNGAVQALRSGAGLCAVALHGVFSKSLSSLAYPHD